MEGEIGSFIKVWTIATTCLCYCYYISSRVPPGIPRLLSLLPILYIFLLLPLELRSMHLCGPTSFFLVWLGIFKLVLFSFARPPLSPLPPKLLHFILLACLPIRIKQGPSPASRAHNGESPSAQQDILLPRWVLLSVKFLVLAAIFHSYKYRHLMHPYLVLALYCLHVYLELEIVLAISATPARTILGFELEAQFNEPYLATSLQDFWGRRWNLMVTNILRPTVYHPLRSRARNLIGPRWASTLAVVASFTVSGLMHELIYYHVTRVGPTWEVTRFFVLHGVAVAVEVVAKKAVGGGWQLSRAVSGPLTLLFTAATANWLFFPQLTRNHVDDKIIGEYTSFVHFVKEALGGRLGMSSG